MTTYSHIITCLKKNLNASRPSGHPPISGKNVKTFSRWDHRLQIKNLSMSLKRFPLWVVTFWVNSIMSRRSSPIYCTLTLLIAIQGHQTKEKSEHLDLLSIPHSQGGNMSKRLVS